ncbi:MAG TPA: hypothetical protein VH143_15605 [Kofleriaceae bacterium]|jgi:uncharacterized protein (TIGR02996 family)|nr:hypothetical protein [Kofleriaceae bacterium]
MARYVLGDDVWQVTQTGKQLAITSGGKQTLRTFLTPEQAAAQLHKLVEAKLAAGYVAAVTDPRERALEAEIIRDPDNPVAYGVLGDWLEQHGDPRGTLIALSLAKLDAQAKKHLALHVDYLLGPLAALAPDDVAWQLGYIRKVHLQADRHAPLDAWVMRVLDNPSARFLGELSIGGQTRAAEAIAVVAERVPATLRALRLWQMWQQDLGALWAAMPALRRLSLAGQALALGTFELPELERLEIVDSELSNANARVIARARWPKLAQLKLDFGTGYLTGDASIDDVFGLLARRDLSKLSRLALLHTRYIRELVRELPASPIAPQLELLDLSSNQMTDEHALELARHKDKFPQLQQLDVSANRLSSAGIDALGVLAPKIRALRQDS